MKKETRGRKPLGTEALKKICVALDQEDIKTLDDFFPNRSVGLRLLIKKFKAEMKKEAA